MNLNKDVILRGHRKFVRSLAHGSLAWVILFALAAFQFCLFSIPSTGWARTLIPGFFATGVLLAVGAYSGKTRIAVYGGGLFVACSIARATFLWGIDQGGAGSNVLASIVWIWIALACLCFTLAIDHRGIKT